jgi:hypothetical protein
MFPSLGRLKRVDGNANEPGVLATAASLRAFRCAYDSLSHTAMKKLRIVMLGFGTAR